MFARRWREAASMVLADAKRGSTWSRMHTLLTGLDDTELAERLRAASKLGTGIGGKTLHLVVEGTTVFVKAVSLTDLETRPEGLRSTANLFGLPSYCQYNVGSPGINAWRELEALERTTRWVLEGEASGFPLLYHWRLLPGDPPPPEPEHADPGQAVAYWHGAQGVARRLAAIRASTTVLLLFLEYHPQRLDTWLRDRLDAGGTAAAEAIEMADHTLLAPVVWMNQHGLFHFDSHLANLLTDGRQVLVTDFGLASARDFALDAGERRFLDRHRLHDPAYTVTKFVNFLVTELTGIADPRARDAYIVEYASGRSPGGLLPAAEAIVHRYAPVAQIINAVYWQLFTERRDIEFPTSELARASDRCGLPR
jgi:hypothetical protein